MSKEKQVALRFKASIKGLKSYDMGSFKWQDNEIHEVSESEAKYLLDDFGDYFQLSNPIPEAPKVEVPVESESKGSSPPPDDKAVKKPGSNR